ncbi:hypothetical protein BRADI_1g63915v3 [Brachypodium distachyon]|uniref:Uncharacterized protein n=1 Tax=Brachypodium distachyon TaxID=15368 RepID=A0A0Q3LFZ0_BRADI|nr:hypothetical protein BRADI_1g63915v3 [Brachypodium distachyon]
MAVHHDALGPNAEPRNIGQRITPNWENISWEMVVRIRWRKPASLVSPITSACLCLTHPLTKTQDEKIDTFL